MFRDLDPGRGTKRKREKDRLDLRKSKRPELPVTGPGRGGRVGASTTQHVVQNLVRDRTRDEDVSVAMLCCLSLSPFRLRLCQCLFRPWHVFHMLRKHARSCVQTVLSSTKASAHEGSLSCCWSPLTL